MSGHSHTFNNARWKRRSADRTRGAMEHRPVGCPATAEVMAFDQPGKAVPFTGADNVNEFVRVENIDHNLVAGIRDTVSADASFAKHPNRSGVVTGFLEVAGHRLVHALRLHKLDETKLHCVIAVVGHGFFLDDNAGAGLNHSYRDDRSVVLQQLRHADFLSY